jgi:O-antigen ligase
MIMTYFIFIFLIIFAFIAARNLRWAIFLVLASMPSYLIRFQIFGVPTTVLEIMIIVIFFVWLIKNFQFLSLWDIPRRGTIFKKYKLLCFFASLFLLAATIGLFVSPNLREAAGIWKAYFIEPALFFIVLISELRGLKDAKFVISALGVSAFYVSIYAILQRFFGAPIPAPWQSELRITSVFPYPNAVGLYLAPLIPLFVYQLISNFQFSISNKIPNSKFQIPNYLSIGYWGLVIFISLIAIYFAKTEAALVALAAGLIFFLLFYNNKSRLILFSICFLFLIFGFLFSGSNLFSTIENKLLLKDWSGMVRTTMWSETWEMLKDKPIFGAGLSGYQTAILPYHKANWMEIFLYPHNIIFNFWSETGLLGLLSFIAIVVLFFWNLRIWNFIRNLKLEIRNLETNERNRRLFLLLGTSMVVLLVHGLVDVPYFKNDLSVLFWTIVALPIILKNDKIN